MVIARRLNGWLGVFVVLITFYAFAVGAIAIATAPKESNIMSAWSWEVLGVLESDVKRTSAREITASQFRTSKEFAGKTDEQIAREMTKNALAIDLADPDKKDLARYKEEVSALAVKYEVKLRELPSEQRKHAAIAFIVLPSLAVLLLGYAVAWIVRGFKRNVGNAP